MNSVNLVGQLNADPETEEYVANSPRLAAKRSSTSTTPTGLEDQT